MNKQEMEQKFEEVYKAKIEPQLQSLEDYRLKNLKPWMLFVNKYFKKFFIASFIGVFVCIIPLAIVVTLIMLEIIPQYPVMIFIPFWGLISIVLFFLPFIIIGIYFVYSAENNKYRKELKSRILKYILGIFGDFYLKKQGNFIGYSYNKGGKLNENYKAFINSLFQNNQSEVITLDEIKELELYSNINTQGNDDTVMGHYENIPLVLAETILYFNDHHPFMDSFRGLIFKCKMNKTFNCHTVGCRKSKKKSLNLEKVYLEDIKFNDKYNIFSNNQVEARYLITPSFMERIKNIKNLFMAKTVEFIFKDEYLYLFLNYDSKFIDNNVYGLLELGDICKTAINKRNYKKVFMEIYSLFSLIDYFKLNQRTGL